MRRAPASPSGGRRARSRRDVGNPDTGATASGFLASRCIYGKVSLGVSSLGLPRASRFAPRITYRSDRRSLRLASGRVSRAILLATLAALPAGCLSATLTDARLTALGRAAGPTARQSLAHQVHD